MSKGVISLQNDRGTSYAMYISVQNELARAFNEMKADLAKNTWGKTLDQLTEEQINAIKAKKKSWWADFARFYQQAMIWAESRDTGAFQEDVTSQQLYNDEEFILRSLAEQESCIILGRTGFHIFRNEKNVLKVFLIADRTYRRDKVARRLNINEGSADALIDKVDEARENFTQSFSGKSRYDAHNYDLVINVTGMEPQAVALMIADCVKCKLQQGH